MLVFVWLNSLETPAQIAEACARVPAPIMTVYGGPYPRPTLAEYETLGLRFNLYIGLVMRSPSTRPGIL